VTKATVSLKNIQQLTLPLLQLPGKKQGNEAETAAREKASQRTI